MGTQLSLGVLFVSVMLTYYTRLFMLFLSNECENVCFQCRDAVNSLIRTYKRVRDSLGTGKSHKRAIAH